MVTLDWPGCHNARDVGGLPTVDGSAIRPRALLRSGHHTELTAAGIAAVRAAGISRVLDLRRDVERDAYPSPFAGDPGYVSAPVLLDVVTYEYPDDSYGPLLDHNQQRIAAAFRAIAGAPPGGVLVHCRGGRDRTGVLVALALSVAGVAPDVIAGDYALTEGSPAAVMLNTFEHLEQAYGGVTAYLSLIGITEAERAAVRERLREPAYLTETRDGYNRFAAEYAGLFGDVLARNVWERALLGGFAELVRAEPGPVLEVGCGIGTVTAYLHGLGVDIAGLDLAPEMVAAARRDHPSITFDVGTMTALARPEGTLAAVLAWYSIIHVPDDELPVVLTEFRRVLRPGGYVFLAFQVGDEARHVRDITFLRRRPEQVAGMLREAGFDLCLRSVRAPDQEGAAEQLPQAYLLARTPKPAPGA
ncbi:tyrosine-protein phosphatase [Couchioplanes caeruleus]|uniref:tyrosine-protein phosphatase n=1 Tax=Couchioplanes caeruleus TaxID=56438 RepID=UPI0020C06678|nr:tyrosine-protein phosphatase [Couchioplanes caeruleus]UQU61997.1 tyrosine-protein phosphatase [Couchioplanes caeruleus]